jgi:hypothetical protein
MNLTREAALSRGSNLDRVRTMPPIYATTPSALDDIRATAHISTRTLARLALLTIASHAILLATTHWMLFHQFLDRAMPDLEHPLRIAFSAYSVRGFGLELSMLGAAATAVLAVRLAIGGGNGRRVAASGLIAYLPVALYSLIVVLALAFGWEPDIWIMSAADATDPQVAATLAEALPIVLQPFAIGRLIATVVAALAFAVLQRRVCGLGARGSVVAALAAGAAAVLVHVLSGTVFA